MKNIEQKLISLNQVLDRVCLSKSRIYSLMNAGLFPRPIKTGLHRVSWLDSEISEYIQIRIEERNAKYSSGKAGA